MRRERTVLESRMLRYGGKERLCYNTRLERIMGASLAETRSGRRGAEDQASTTFNISRGTRPNRQSQLRTEVIPVVTDELGEFFRIARQFPLLDEKKQLPLVLKAYSQEKEQNLQTEKPEITALNALKRDPEFLETITEKDEALFARLFTTSGSVEQMLVLTNLRLVITIAKIWEREHLSTVDRIHAGIPGLIEGIRTCDPEKGKFSAHVTRRIKNHITDATAEAGYSVKIPKNVLWDVRLMYRLSSDFEDTHHGQSPSKEKLIALFVEHGLENKSQSKNTEAQEKDRTLRAENALAILESHVLTSDSLNSPTLIEDQEEIDRLSNPTENTEEDALQAVEITPLQRALAKLSPEEAEVLYLHYKYDLSFTKIAEKLGKTRRQIDSIQKTAQEKLRKLLTADKAINAATLRS